MAEPRSGALASLVGVLLLGAAKKAPKVSATASKIRLRHLVLPALHLLHVVALDLLGVSLIEVAIASRHDRVNHVHDLSVGLLSVAFDTLFRVSDVGKRISCCATQGVACGALIDSGEDRRLVFKLKLRISIEAVETFLSTHGLVPTLHDSVRGLLDRELRQAMHVLGQVLLVSQEKPLEYLILHACNRAPVQFQVVLELLVASAALPQSFALRGELIFDVRSRFGRVLEDASLDILSKEATAAASP